MKTKWRMPHPATMFMLLTMAVVFLSWICDIYGLKVTLPQTGEDIRVQSLLSPEGIRWWLRNIPGLLMRVSVWGWGTGKRKRELFFG